MLTRTLALAFTLTLTRRGVLTGACDGGGGRGPDDGLLREYRAAEYDRATRGLCAAHAPRVRRVPDGPALEG